MDLPKGQKSMTDFAKTSTAKAKEQSDAADAANTIDPTSPFVTTTEGITTVDEMDFDMPERLNDSIIEIDDDEGELSITPTTAGAEEVKDQPMTE